MSTWRRSTLAAVVVAAALGVGVAFAVTTDRRPRCESFPAALDGGTRMVCGPVLDRYLAEGGPEGMLGRPLDEEAPNTLPRWQPYGDRVAVFARGAIYLDTRTGTGTGTGTTGVPGVWTPYRP